MKFNYAIKQFRLNGLLENVVLITQYNSSANDI